MATREIITLQLGNYANYIGTHWWNIQEASFNYDPNNSTPSDVNHDVLFRSGENQRGNVTYTPRMVLLDLAGSLGAASMEGELYEDSIKGDLLTGDPTVVSTHTGWESSAIDVINGPKTLKSEYQKDLDEGSTSTNEPTKYKFHETVSRWTDFMYTRYHPRSINILHDYKNSPEENEFDTYTNGREMWSRDGLNDGLLEKTRQYLEECSNCQGFQVIFNADDGFSGMALKCMEEVTDEYGKTILALPVLSPASVQYKNCDRQMSATIRVANIALCYSNLIEKCNLFVPLSTMETCWRDIKNPRIFDGFDYLPDNLYQTSAIIATYLDTISLKYRLNSASGTHLTGFCTDLTNYGRKMCAAGLALPFAMNTTEDLIDCLDRQSSSRLFTDLSPNSNIGSMRVVQSMCLRGIPEYRLKQPLKSSKEQSRMAAYRCESVAEMMQLFYQCLNHGSLSHCTSVASGMATRVPYPLELFDERISQNGFQFHKPNMGRLQNEFVQSIPVLATAQNSSDLSNTISSLHREAARIKIDKIYRFKETGLDPDEYKQSLEMLLDFQDLYEEKYDL